GWLGAVLGVSGAVAVGGIALAVGALLIAALIALQGRRERTAGTRTLRRWSASTPLSPGGSRSRRLSVPSAPLVPDQSCATDQREPGESRRHCDVGARLRELLIAVVGSPLTVGRAAAVGGVVLAVGT